MSRIEMEAATVAAMLAKGEPLPMGTIVILNGPVHLSGNPATDR